MKLINLIKKIFGIKEGQCVGGRVVFIDDIAERIKIRKEYIFNDRVIVIDEYENFPQSHYM